MTSQDILDSKIIENSDFPFETLDYNPELLTSEYIVGTTKINESQHFNNRN